MKDSDAIGESQLQVAAAWLTLSFRLRPGRTEHLLFRKAFAIHAVAFSKEVRWRACRALWNFSFSVCLGQRKVVQKEKKSCKSMPYL